MNAEIKEKLIHIVILDISGIYAQIHNQGFFEEGMVNEIKAQYSDRQHWRVVVIDYIQNKSKTLHI